MYKVGSIVLLNNKKGLLPSLIKFFARTDISHNAITMGEIIVPESVISAEAVIAVYPLTEYNSTQYSYEIYSLVGNSSVLEKLTRDNYVEFAGQKYGFFQLLWFVYRYIAEMFGKDVKKRGNWFPNGPICSEQIYNHMKNYAICFEHKDLLQELEKWNSNCVHPGDIKDIILGFPQYFKKV